MITAADLVETARSMLGTPFHHQGRLPGVGLDCAGLLVCTLRALGLAVEDVRGYPRQPDGRLLDLVERQTLPGAVEPGAVLVIRFRGEPHHLAWCEGEGIIHALSTVGRVTRHPLDERWRRLIVAARRVRGVVY